MKPARGQLKTGFDSVRGAKWRNFWTMLGIIIGVSSVITVVGIGQGIKNQISGQINYLGKDLITIRPSSLRTGGDQSLDTYNVLSGLSITGSLQDKDVQAVSKAPGVRASAPLSAISTTVKSEKGQYKKGLVIGTSASLPNLLNQPLEFGTFLDPDDPGARAAVLGKAAAEAMFESDVPLGFTFSINGQDFIVRGIFDQFKNTPLSDEANFNTAIFIPYDVSQELTKNSGAIYEILAKPATSSPVDTTIASIKTQLNQTHGNQDNFTVLRQDENIAARSEVLDLLTRLITGVAAISLLVGGIGIMNVMLVSVTERMHEIGIRKAIGATNRQILSQFVIESALLSFVGGIIGVALAFIVNGLLRFFTNLRPDISWQIVLIASGVSLAVGIIFGSVPALKAARKDPIEALRTII
ncbi:MAG: hypothetical protein JWM81_62 [Candidatus Saccharibacteria bacterium]|nr:hypothetical protein [Candidatus Saccharibacteria bacterium]